MSNIDREQRINFPEDNYGCNSEDNSEYNSEANVEEESGKNDGNDHDIRLRIFNDTFL